MSGGGSSPRPQLLASGLSSRANRDRQLASTNSPGRSTDGQSPFSTPTTTTGAFHSNHGDADDIEAASEEEEYLSLLTSPTSTATATWTSTWSSCFANSSLLRNTRRRLRHHHHYPQSPRKRTTRRRRTMWFFLLVFVVLASSIFAYLYRSEKALRVRWTPDPESKLFSQRPLPPPLERTMITQYELPLRTSGRHIVDGKDRRFKLASINWYGASDELFVVGGLDVAHRDVIAQTIKRMGFNSVRLPYADELVMRNPPILPHLVTANKDLANLPAMDVYEAVVTSLTKAGIAVIINNHITSAKWCCGADPCDAHWANDHLGPLCPVKQTEDEWIEHWENVMSRFLDNPLVIGADLRNEVRGLWGTMPWSKWAKAAERCGNRLLDMKSDWLIVVEGTESANDLSGARTRPVQLKIPNRLVYSAHIYAWSGWGEADGRFSKRTYASFVKTMRAKWGYLVEENVAPVWVGELGAPDHPSVGDAHYWQNMWRYLKAVDADFGYWALNPRKPPENVRERYSLVKDDWVTPLRDYRMKDMTELMRQ